MKNEKMADITAELHDLCRAMDVKSVTSADGLWITTTVFGKPIREYFGELADRIDAALLYERVETATIAATISTNLASGGKTATGTISGNDAGETKQNKTKQQER